MFSEAENRLLSGTFGTAYLEGLVTNLLHICTPIMKELCSGGDDCKVCVFMDGLCEKYTKARSTRGQGSTKLTEINVKGDDKWRTIIKHASVNASD